MRLTNSPTFNAEVENNLLLYLHSLYSLYVDNFTVTFLYPGSFFVFKAVMIHSPVVLYEPLENVSSLMSYLF